jgi:hypothetical protein
MLVITSLLIQLHDGERSDETESDNGPEGMSPIRHPSPSGR